MNTKTAQILLVEDNEGDIILLQEALGEMKILHKLEIMRDGEDALNYLFKRDIYENAITPDLIILDINIPKINGKEVLLTIKNDPFLQVIPVIILTSSSAKKDVYEAYKNHANCYVVKPHDFSQLSQTIYEIEKFWFRLTTLPSSEL